MSYSKILNPVKRIFSWQYDFKQFVMVRVNVPFESSSSGLQKCFHYNGDYIILSLNESTSLPISEVFYITFSSI